MSAAEHAASVLERLKDEGRVENLHILQEHPPIFDVAKERQSTKMQRTRLRGTPLGENVWKLQKNSIGEFLLHSVPVTASTNHRYLIYTYSTTRYIAQKKL